MSKLLARAKVKRFTAENSYHLMSYDDAYIDECCFALQQTIEFCLKYIVEINGERYIENHDIRAQMNKLKEMNIVIPCESKLRILASTINAWEVETRYNDKFVALIEDIDDCRKVADELIAYCDQFVLHK